MKRDTDDADLRAVRASYEARNPSCPFCNVDGQEIVLQNPLALVIRDKFPVTTGHLLVIPRRHVADYFDLGSAESRSCDRLIREARKLVSEWDDSVAGVNVGVNSGKAAGQTVMHCHIHLIPRRRGDVANPRGGVRGVIAGQADYTEQSVMSPRADIPSAS